MTGQPLPFSPAVPCRRWTVTLTSGETRVVEAAACRTEHGCLLFAEPAGLVVALAADQWLSVALVTEGNR